jgi:hypothetical protein
MPVTDIQAEGVMRQDNTGNGEYDILFLRCPPYSSGRAGSRYVFVCAPIISGWLYDDAGSFFDRIQWLILFLLS